MQRSRAVARANSTTAASRAKTWQTLWLVLLLSGVTVVAYYPCLWGPKLLDDEVLVENSIVRAPDGLHRFWLTTDPQDYWPVTNSTYWLEWRLWGRHLAAYHSVNLLLHIVDCLLLWLTLSKLKIPGAYLAALLFAVHPVNVESVAWISQRKNLLALFFVLLSTIWYLKSQDVAAEFSFVPKKNAGGSPFLLGARWYVPSLLAFVLAMLSKGSVATFPLTLLLLAWWQYGKIRWHDIKRVVPFLVVAVILSFVNMWFQTHGGTAPIDRGVTPLERLLGAGAVVWFYLGKALLPINLAFIYPQWDIHANQWQSWLPLIACIATTTVLIWKRNSFWGRPILLAWVFYCLALLPVMGFTDVGFMQYSLVADHYQHLALIGVVALIAAAFVYGLTRLPRPSYNWVSSLAAVTVIALAFLTWQQNRLYGNGTSLYEATLRLNPNSVLTRTMLGGMYNELDERQAAIDEFQKAAQLDPNSADAQNGWGLVLEKTGNLAEAMDHYRQALQLKPDHVEACMNVGNLLAKNGRFQEAIPYYRQVIQLQPDYAQVYNNLGNALTKLGDYSQAIDNFRHSLKLMPEQENAHYNMANALIAISQVPQAIAQFEEALRLNPDYVDAHINLGAIFTRSGETTTAISHFRRALQINPDSAEAHSNLGVALTQAKEANEAVEQFEQALRLKPGYLQAAASLPHAYAEANRPQDAVAAAEKAIKLARDQGQTVIAQQIQNWLTNYRAQHPLNLDAP